MLRHVDEPVDTGVSRDSSAFIFTFKHS